MCEREGSVGRRESEREAESGSGSGSGGRIEREGVKVRKRERNRGGRIEVVGRGPTSHEKREVGCQAYTQFCSGARISAAPIRLQYFKRLVHTSLAASQMKYRC